MMKNGVFYFGISSFVPEIIYYVFVQKLMTSNFNCIHDCNKRIGKERKGTLFKCLVVLALVH